MLGDELKKALEPIQTSDELLEKTRRAIEQARVQQAQETLDKAVRKDARRTLFLKAMIPVACVLLIFGGLAVVLLPKLSNGKKDEKGRSGAIKEHNDAINNVTAEIDSILDKDDVWSSTINKKTDQTWQTEAFEDSDGSAENTTSSEAEWYAEDTTADTSVDKHSGDISDLEMYQYFSKSTSVMAEDHIISISDDETGIIVDFDDTHTLTPQIKNGTNYLGPRSSTEEDKITGLYFDEDAQILYITISHFDESKYKYVASKRYLYAISFKDGKLSEEGPELVCETDF